MEAASQYVRLSQQIIAFVVNIVKKIAQELQSSAAS